MNRIVKETILYLIGVLLVILGILGYINIFHSQLDCFSFMSLILISSFIFSLGIGTILFSIKYIIKEEL